MTIDRFGLFGGSICSIVSIVSIVEIFIRIN